MARLNVRTENDRRTHEGAKAVAINPKQELRRSVMSCLLWEDEFYENGESISKRIEALSWQVTPYELAELAVEARTVMNLRHVPLLLTALLANRLRGDSLVAITVWRVIQRADEIAELVAIYWRNGRKPLSAQMKKGLAAAFFKFDAYQFAKYDRDAKVKLADVIRLVRPKPENEDRAALFKAIRERSLTPPDTWEVALSGGADKKATFERLIREGNLGYLALLRNLRNMVAAGVDRTLVRNAILDMKNGAHKVFPYQFLAAAREAPDFEGALDNALERVAGQQPRIAGKTIIVVDVSGSMGGSMSGKSRMDRMDAACALAAIIRAACDEPVVYATAGNDMTRIHATAKIPARNGMALVDAIRQAKSKLGGGGIFLKPMLDFVQKEEKSADRIVVITDEQDCAVADRDRPNLAKPFGRHNYLINVASYQNGIGYGAWTHLDGFSQAIGRYIIEAEGAE